MTLRTQLSGLRWLVWLAAVVGALGVSATLRTTPIYFVPLVVVAALYLPRPIGLAVVRAAYRRLRRLNEARDFPASRKLILELRELYVGSRPMTEQLRLQESLVHSLEGRHADAVALLTSIDRTCLGAAYESLLLNNLAWSLALSGNAPLGVQRARESIATSAKAGNRAVTPYDLRAYQLGTLGTALVLAGESEEGVPYLEQALARGGRPRDQAVRAFYLGEGLRATAKLAEAAQAYERSVKEEPEGEYAARADCALKTMRAYR